MFWFLQITFITIQIHLFLFFHITIVNVLIVEMLITVYVILLFVNMLVKQHRLYELSILAHVYKLRTESKLRVRFLDNEINVFLKYIFYLCFVSYFFHYASLINSVGKIQSIDKYARSIIEPEIENFKEGYPVYCSLS